MYKKLLTTFVLLFAIHMAYAQNEFVTTWKPGNLQIQSYQGITVNSTNTQIWLPAQGTDYTIAWEEIGYPSHTGVLTNVTSAYHTLVDFGASLNPDPANATYRVKISNGNGLFQRIRFTDWDLFSNGNGIIGDIHKILTLEQWGQINWTTMRQAFQGCMLMDVTATDIPRLSAVTDLSFMFTNCSNLIGNPTINNWNVSSVTNLQSTFQGCFLFNQPIGDWNTSNVINMGALFLMAKIFNQPIGNWNTSKVETMTATFNNAREFNQPIGSWDLSKNLDCEFMFSNAVKFNQPIGNWNTSKVIEMNRMFSNATAFNQDIGSWNTGNVTNMEGMFANASSFNKAIGNWNVGEVLYMQYMFNGASAFDQNISGWNTGKVTAMQSMFSNAVNFNQNIGNWNVSLVTGMGNMFTGALKFNQNLGSWNLASLQMAGGMLQNTALSCQNYDDTLQGWSINPSTPGNINISPVSPLTYSHPAAVTARNYLVSAKNWTISGDTYDAECRSTLGISEILAESAAGIYPNPATDFIYVRNLKVKSFMIIDQSGRIVIKNNTQNSPINVQNLVPGNYILQINTATGVHHFKFIKK